ncbi:MAG: multicopper oxidase family protein [Pseudomonadota bacterium]
MIDAPFSRRTFLLGAAACVTAGAGALGVRAEAAAPLKFRSRKTAYAFGAGGGSGEAEIGAPMTEGLVSFLDNAPPPIIRLRQNTPALLQITNGLEEYTTLHWHGIRLPNAMDGVPYLTQLPMAQDETFTYAFTPPDAGTFWYHPHCMTLDQMAFGLTGLLIVDEPEDLGFDDEVALNLKDFRLDAEGQLLPAFTPKGAARAGTLGALRTANWAVAPTVPVPTGGLVRLRIAATDTTRIYRLILPGLEGRVIAWDGHPVREAVAWPSEEAPLVLGPGQRVDLAVRVPTSEGVEATVTDFGGARRTPLATLKTVGSPTKRDLRDLARLTPANLAEPDLAGAQTMEFVFGWTPDGNGQNNGFCGAYGYTFWSINRTPWAGDAEAAIAPLAELTLGKSYIMRLRNESPNAHPIHLHGLAFLPIASNQRTLPKNWTDTLMLLKGETVEIALVADNPGDWAFHCHIIEHQKTGLAGFIRVT